MRPGLAGLLLGAACPRFADAFLPEYTEQLGEQIWQRATGDVQALGGTVNSNEYFVCASGNWGDGPQCDQWDQGASPCWPSAMTVSASWDVELMARWSYEMSEEFGAHGRGQLGPGVNLARFAWNGRLGEYQAGEDPFFGARMVEAMVKAYRKVAHPAIQVVKHWVPNTIETNRKTITEVVDERTLFEVYYPPFQAAIDAGVPAVMCSYNVVHCTGGVCNGPPSYACANDDVLNKHLKMKMGFKGMVISDWDATNCANPDTAGCSPGQYIDNAFAAKAGLDLEEPTCMTFKGGVTDRAAEKATRMRWTYLVQGREPSEWPAPSGRLRRLSSPQANGTAALAALAPAPTPARSLAAPSWSTGVYEHNPFGNAPPAPPPAAGTTPATAAPGITTCPDEGNNNYKSGCKLDLADQFIAEATTVLKNENNVLPIQRGKTVALVGEQACATDPIAQGGGSGWNGMACNKVAKINVKDGIAAINAGAQVSCPDQGSGNSQADAADVVIVVVSPAKASEGTDRQTLQLSPADTQLIRGLAHLKNKLVVAMNAPGPMITNTWDSGVSAVTVSWLPGQQNGKGIAMALYNEQHEASGRLPFTFPKCATTACSNADERASVHLGDSIDNKAYLTYSEKALIGYRWYHSQGKEVAYPFGYGLFAYGSAQVQYSSVAFSQGQGLVTVSCQLSHAGPRAGKDVPQLYLKFPSSVPGDANIKPEWVLKGFTKLSLQPNAPATAKFSLRPRDLSYWDDGPGQSKWVLAKGTFQACVGANARDAILPGHGACGFFEVGDGGITTVPGPAPAAAMAAPTSAPTAALAPVAVEGQGGAAPTQGGLPVWVSRTLLIAGLVVVLGCCIAAIAYFSMQNNKVRPGSYAPASRDVPGGMTTQPAFPSMTVLGSQPGAATPGFATAQRQSPQQSQVASLMAPFFSAAAPSVPTESAAARPSSPTGVTMPFSSFRRMPVDQADPVTYSYPAESAPGYPVEQQGQAQDQGCSAFICCRREGPRDDQVMRDR